MVAITVILAAVIAAAVMDIGGNVGDTAPTLSTDISTNSDWSATGDTEMFYVNHVSGDTIDSTDLKVVVRDQNGGHLATLDSDGLDSDANDVSIDVDGVGDGSADFSSGSTITISIDDGTDNTEGNDEITVQVIDSASGTTVADHTRDVPN